MTASSSMREVLAEFPGAQRALFRKYHIGGCSSCGFQPDETLAALCARNNALNPAEVMDHIRASHEADLKIEVAPGDLAAWMQRDPSLKVVDIRAREEHEAARIEGSILFTQDLMQEILGRWPRENALVLYDHQGRKSMDAAAYFQGHGFQNVRSLRGGIDAWSLEVDPRVPRYQLE